MLLRRMIPIFALAALAFSASFALAGGGSSGSGAPNGWAGNIYIVSRDAPLPTSSLIKGGIVGLGYEMTGKWMSSPHWGWAASFDYGIGDLKETNTSGGISSTSELSLSSWSARFGWDYWDECCDEDWYCGPGFMYMSTSATDKSTGSPDQKINPLNVYGLDSRAGGAVKLFNNTRLFGSWDMLVGYGSYDQTQSGTETKLNGWFTATSMRGGLRWMY
jgi:hypothetical protein